MGEQRRADENEKRGSPDPFFGNLIHIYILIFNTPSI